MRTLDDFKKQYCTGEFSSLFVTFNDQACSYVKPGDKYFQMERIEQMEWPSDAEREQALKSNSIWEIQWYPDTPISSYHIAASTFERALKYAYDVARQDTMSKVAARLLTSGHDLP